MHLILVDCDLLIKVPSGDQNDWSPDGLEVTKCINKPFD